jgi:hypothetical protein
LDAESAFTSDDSTALTPQNYPSFFQHRKLAAASENFSTAEAKQKAPVLEI